MQAKINHRRTIHQGRVIRLLSENVTLPNGVTTELDLVRHPGASAIVALTPQRELLLLDQYRHAVGTRLWEIPAGTLHPGEPPLDCARRELTEETGFKAQVWQALGTIVPVPGYSDERIHLFLATDLVPAAQDLDADEVLEVHAVPLPEVWEMVKKGRIQDAKTLCGLTLAFGCGAWKG